MANTEAGMSGDAARALGGEYQVFLSFRGSDTRYGFTDFLYHGLLDAGVRVFRDEEELRVGEVIGGNIVCAINNSMIYIPIFSRTYASSKWCLRELAHMVDNVCKSEGEKYILPIFLDVEPEDVKLKTPTYSNALLEHANKFPAEVEVWRKALADVDEIKGWNVKKDQSQAAIVKLVVVKVLEKLKLKRKSVTEHLIGLDDRVKYLTELLDVNHRDVRLIGIYGMGGIGKTTVAKVVFNELSSHFGKCCSFLENIRESMSTEGGIIQLQKKLLSDIVDLECAKGIEDSEQGRSRIGQILGTMKVLVVLDDADTKEHIKKLIGNNSLHLGSRIIITTRNTTILQVQGFKGEILQYEMLNMDYGHALKLFSRHAFGEDFPSDDYYGLSTEIVSSTGGLPLAVEVIGSLLYQKNKAYWEETVVRLRKVPEKDIQKKLRISYDDLDEYQQQIFLDIACFFFNKEKNNAIHMWASCQFYPERGIDVLLSKCLIKILENDIFWMHDQLIDMGRQIVRQESPSDLKKQSRLWIRNEALEIIRTNDRKDKVQAIEISQLDGLGEITNEEFDRLPNLRFLNLDHGTFVGDFAKSHSNLRWISWCSPYRNFLAENMYLDRLVIFKLDSSDFTDDSKAWDLIKRAQNLKVLSLTRCDGITTIPDISNCLGLESLTIRRCRNLERIESFIGNLLSLINLQMVDCIGLTNLLEEVGALVKLKRFSLWGCYSLTELSIPLENLTLLEELDLSYTGIRELPDSIGNLKSLRILRFAKSPTDDWENHFWRLPSGISMLVNLEELNLFNQCVTGEIPIGIKEFSSLEILNLEGTGIYKMPKTINMVRNLQILNLWDCDAFQELPELPKSLTSLSLKSESLCSVPNLSNLTNLVNLRLSNSKFTGEKSKPLTGCNLSWIGRLSRLKKLELELLGVPASPELASLSHLKELVLRHLKLKPLVQLSSSDWSFINLFTLEIGGCEVENIPLDGLQQLKELTVDGCKQLQRLSITLELRELQKVYVSTCPDLIEIQVVGLSKSLQFLGCFECKSVKRINGLSYSKNLQILTIRDCNLLTDVEGLNELESLHSLELWKCPSLRRSINVCCTKIKECCTVNISLCGDAVKDSKGCMSLKRYREEILLDTSNQSGHLFTIIFHLGVKKPSWRLEFFGGIKRQKENVTSDSVTYEGLINDVKSFGFRLKRMWYKTPSECCDLFKEIRTDEQVKVMLQLAFKEGSIHLYVEGEFDSEWEGEYDDEMMEMLREESVMKTDVYSDEDWAEWDVSGPDEDPDSASVGESENDGTSAIDDFHSKPCGAECFESTRRSTRDERIRHSGDVNGGQTTSDENREKEKDESAELANQNDVVRSSCQRCKGVEYHERSCEAGTEVNDEEDISSVKRDRTVETDQISTKTGRGSGAGRASNPGSDTAERGRGRGVASGSRNSKGSRLGRDTASTSGRGKASNSGRRISLISRSSTTLSSGRDTIFILGRGRGSSPRRGTTNMDTSSSSGRGIVSSSRSSSALSAATGRGSTSGKGATVSSGQRASLRSGKNKRSSSVKTEPQTPIS